MRIPATAALLLFVSASPALATAGLLCRPVRGDGPTLSLVIGHGIGNGVAGANLFEAGRDRSTFREADDLALGQSWIDRQRVWVDLTDRNALRYEGRLRVAFEPPRRRQSTTALGTFVRNGRTYRVRCEEA